MKQKEFESAVRKLLGRRPFRPFAVELSSGERVVVRHPELMAFDGDTAVILHRGGFSIFDEDQAARITNAGNGAAAK